MISANAPDEKTTANIIGAWAPNNFAQIVGARAK
jgi:hypothetical protein